MALGSPLWKTLQLKVCTIFPIDLKHYFIIETKFSPNNQESGVVGSCLLCRDNFHSQVEL
jgi:hypothetical protein